MGMLALVEQGKLTLDEDVNVKLKSWKVPDNDFTKEQKVTLRRLASHSAGLTVHGFRGYAKGEPVPTTVQVLDGEKPANSAPVRVDLLPGSRWRYSGGGITAMQLLMTEVTGKAFPALMQELVLSKIGMKNSTYEQPLPDGKAPQAATGHRGNGNQVTGKWHTYPEIAAAGLWTTPTDLAKFALEVQQAYAGKSRNVLSQAMTRQFLTKQSGEYGLGIGLGGAITVKMASWLTGRFGWQTALLCLGILMAAVALPLTLMVNDKSEEFQLKNNVPTAPLGEILRSPSFYLLVIGSLCSIGAVGATNQHLKLYLARDNGFAQDKAANVIALVLFTSNVGRILMGWLADRFPSHVLVWPVLVQGPEAAGQVSRAIKGFNALQGANRPDVLIVARGGGSMHQSSASPS